MTQSLERTRRKEMLDRAKEHAEMDRLIQDRYFAGFKGCSLGCHFMDITGRNALSCVGAAKPIGETLSEHYMIPRWLLQLQEHVYEGLELEEAQFWHVEFAQAIYDLPDDVNWAAVSGSMRKELNNQNPLIARATLTADQMRRRLLKVLGEFAK